MSSDIRYSIRTKRGHPVLRERDHVCWANYYREIPKRARDWTTTIKLWQRKSKFYDEIFDQLVGHWLKPEWFTSVYDRKTGHRKALKYTSECPYWVMVATSSVYRLYDEVPSFANTWESLEALQEHLDYKANPWTLYGLCVTTRRRTDEWKVCYQSTHLPFSGNNICVSALQSLSKWDAYTLSKELPPMSQRISLDSKHPRSNHLNLEGIVDKKLSHAGRDRFFANNYNQPNDWITDMPSVLKKAPTFYAWSESRTIVNMKKLFEEVIIPNNL